ncbi:MAG: hypothetical protein HY800_01790 [Ignavibacteriales bacterium]|nr:hypothetical protein [Ignavibacteriales bacterium]
MNQESPRGSVHGGFFIFLPRVDVFSRFKIFLNDLLLINLESQIIEPGIIEINVGGRQPGKSGRADLSTTEILTKQFEVNGEPFVFDECN